jgi:molybdopterin-synthase adenylyltransferase
VADPTAPASRYDRQARYPAIGDGGQQRIGAAVVTVVGCGALGSAVVNLCARAGVGEIRIIDRDVVDLTNLQRQLLFEEQDAKAGTPKAAAAASAVARINSGIRAVPIVADLTPANAETLLAGSSVVVDGTDNLETRFLLNDACVRAAMPWVYGGVIGSTGMAMAISPGHTACLRCLLPAVPDGTRLETCETAGVLSSAVVTVAAYQWTQAIRLIVGAEPATAGHLLSFDVWSGDYHVAPDTRRNDACPCCVERRFDFLDAQMVSRATTLCGRDAIQVSPGRPVRVDLEAIARRLAVAGTPVRNEYLVRALVDARELTVFADGRAIVRGTQDAAEARTLYARWVGV